MGVLWIVGWLALQDGMLSLALSSASRNEKTKIRSSPLAALRWRDFLFCSMSVLAAVALGDTPSIPVLTFLSLICLLISSSSFVERESCLISCFFFLLG